MPEGAIFICPYSDVKEVIFPNQNKKQHYSSQMHLEIRTFIFGRHFLWSCPNDLCYIWKNEGEICE